MNIFVLFFFTLSSAKTVESLADFNSIQPQPRSFQNKIFALLETDGDFTVVSTQLDKVDKMIHKGFELAIDFETMEPIIKGEWNETVPKEGNYIHVSTEAVIAGGETTFIVAELVERFLTDNSLEGIILDNLAGIYYQTGRSTRDVRLLLRRLGIELHKIGKKVGFVVPRSGIIISKSELYNLRKFVDFYILETNNHFDQLIGSRCISPLKFNQQLVKDVTNENDVMLEKTHIIIDFMGVEWCPNQSAQAVNATYFAERMKSIESIEYNEYCDEYFFKLKDECIINYPTVETIQERIEFSKKKNINIVLVHLDHAHPNSFNLL